MSSSSRLMQMKRGEKIMHARTLLEGNLTERMTGVFILENVLEEGYDQKVIDFLTKSICKEQSVSAWNLMDQVLRNHVGRDIASLAA